MWIYARCSWSRDLVSTLTWEPRNRLRISLSPIQTLAPARLAGAKNAKTPRQRWCLNIFPYMNTPQENRSAEVKPDLAPLGLFVHVGRRRRKRRGLHGNNASAREHGGLCGFNGFGDSFGGGGFFHGRPSCLFRRKKASAGYRHSLAKRLSSI